MYSIDLIRLFSLLYSILALKYISVYFSHSSSDGHLRFVGFWIKPESGVSPSGAAGPHAGRPPRWDVSLGLGTRKPHAPGQQREQKASEGLGVSPVAVVRIREAGAERVACVWAEGETKLTHRTVARRPGTRGLGK